MRDKTFCDHQARLTRLLIHIQEHIAAPLNLEQLSAVTHQSPWHLHRIFHAATGEGPAAYVRRIRLEAAARLLQYSRRPVSTIALDVGFETSAAFTKAFRSHFGETPTAMRVTANKNLEATRGIDLHYQYRTLPDAEVLFIRKTGPYNRAPREAWHELFALAEQKGLLGAETRFIGLCHDSPKLTDTARLRYDACISVDKAVPTPAGAGRQTLRGGRFAVFRHQGPYDRLSETFNAIFFDWWPNAGQQLHDGPCMDLYTNPRLADAASSLEIAIPIE